MSERHACRLMGLATIDAPLWVAKTGKGCRTASALEGVGREANAVRVSTINGDVGARRGAANHKRVYRLYREEGLAMRIGRRRIRWNGTAASPAAARPNQRWSIDFVSDCVSTGKVIR